MLIKIPTKIFSFVKTKKKNMVELKCTLEQIVNENIGEF